jgi:hypothetical protein
MNVAFLVALGASFIGALGVIHLVYTFSGGKFSPRDPQVEAGMRATSPRLTRQTTMWKAWVGFNASHSLGVIVFAALYLTLAIGHPETLARSPALLGIALATGLAYLALARAYWFRVPFTGILIATSCFALATLVAFL